MREARTMISAARGLTLALALIALVGARTARADEPAPDKEQATEAPPPGASPALMGEVDVEELVKSAMKTEVTVQEAPAIVSVITGDQIQNMGYRTLADAVGSIPGFQVYGFGNYFALTANPRGINQSALVLRDGLDLTNRGTGTNTLAENIPIEMVRRVELVSGPGGVLWGSNSFIGVINIVSKTADDIEGVEASAGYGTGPGYPDAFKAYAIGGAKFFDDELKVLLHVSYQTHRAFDRDFPWQSFAMSAPPNPMAPQLTTGPASLTDGARSHFLSHEGNIQFGDLSLHWAIPWSDYTIAVDASGNILPTGLPEDAIDCTNPANKLACSNRVDPDRAARGSDVAIHQQYATLRYKRRLLADKLRIEGAVSYIRNVLEFKRYVIPRPSGLAPGGGIVSQGFTSHRVGGTFDGDIVLPWSTRLLVGGEFYYDWLPENIAHAYSDPSVLANATFRCPLDAAGKILVDDQGRLCPLVANFSTNRFTGGVFAVAQSRVHPTLMLDAGVRVQYYAGKRGLDPTILGSGGAVWSFLPDWNLKVNYASGFRPPDLHKTDSNGDTVNWGGNPFLEVERSQTVMGEINTRLLRDYKGIRRLALRADYSYTWLSNLMEVSGGVYRNVSDAGIHSGELLAELYFKRGHYFSMGYTFLDIAHSEKGKLRSVPNQWFVLQGMANLWDRRLFVSTNVKLIGSMEDYNKVPNADFPGGKLFTGETTTTGGTVVPEANDALTARPTDLVVDRISPTALWNAKVFFLLPEHGLRFDADAYNILNVKTPQSDNFMDQTALLEYLPQPRPGISFFLSATYSL